MGTNPYLQWYTDKNEQALYDDLYVEHIKSFGHDVYYLPRTGININQMMNEYEVSQFNSALPIEVYVKNFDSFEGEGQLMAKFGLEIRDQMRLVMSKRSFEQYIKPTTGKERPFEGDCIYIPFLNVVYQLKYVSTSAIFYTLGKMNTYELTLELLEYSNEQFNTGISVIDDLYPAFQNYAADANTYNLESYDNDADNTEINTQADAVLDFSETNPFGADDDP